jgi:putative membrane protein insertion efficiency factor
VLTRLLLAPIRWYQRYLSPLKRTPSCRYLPTCSEYAVEAIKTRGALIGGLKALWRILRCNPLFRGGYDPVQRALPCGHDHAETTASEGR